MSADLPAEQTIKGVVANFGEPVEGATISAIDDTDSVYATTTTDENGQYLIGINEADTSREFQVVAEHPFGPVQLAARVIPEELRQTTVYTFDGSLDGWTMIAGEWEVIDQALVNTSSGIHDMIAREQPSAYGVWEFDHNHGSAYYGASTWLLTDGRESASTRVQTGYGISHKNANSDYGRAFGKAVDGTWTTLLDLGSFGSGWVSYRIERTRDGTFTVFVNDEEIGSVVDTELTEATRFVCRGDHTSHEWRNITIESAGWG